MFPVMGQKLAKPMFKVDQLDAVRQPMGSRVRMVVAQLVSWQVTSLHMVHYDLVNARFARLFEKV
ncbi:hypothetical protein SG18_22120 [Pandoraea apista]|uniref:Uncharacterized protein n=1 Tax=Pandoraea pneumonica TaxID=2508299 RepID=A0A5E4RIU0_9BURK|nr:hypothetical protein SG18_22120 [Pandoraea apista]AKH74359.1 hypothetical protein XM39_22300 [Pandoraea apista]AKI62909.1 hypothetical protein AA956_15625 [Pandoraea apista]VVD62402.1 hypothetical protein PPN31114_00169 [Pandoraea pneumonica]